MIVRTAQLVHGFESDKTVELMMWGLPQYCKNLAVSPVYILHESKNHKSDIIFVEIACPKMI